MSSPIAWVHKRLIHERRVQVLAQHFADLLVRDAEVLDVGCGDGKLAARILALRPDVSIRGIDVLVREETEIPVDEFNGDEIPLQTNSVDVVTLVDVLHHTQSPGQLLCESARVARKQVLLKDHYLQGFAAGKTLKMMDHVGNARHGVEIPCNYLTPSQWDDLYAAAGLKPVECRDSLGLYLPPLNWCFERSLHFIAALKPEEIKEL